jgi:hypothetical protein
MARRAVRFEEELGGRAQGGACPTRDFFTEGNEANKGKRWKIGFGRGEMRRGVRQIRNLKQVQMDEHGFFTEDNEGNEGKRWKTEA